MQITSKTLHKIAHLARLEVQVSEEQAMIDSLSKALAWMEQLNSIDTTNVVPLTHISEDYDLNVWREDIANNAIEREDALKLAPQRTSAYFAVPKVIE